MAEAAAAVPDDDLKKELEAAGYKPPEKGARENRIPWSRVQKILENTRTKLRTSHAAALKAAEEKAAPLQAKAKQADEWEQLLNSDPDGSRTMQALARAMPHKFQRYLMPAQPATTTQPTATAAPATSTAFTEPKPKPDLPDGYSQEGLDKLLDWTARKAASDAVSVVRGEVAEKFAPIEKERNARTQFESSQRDAADRVRKAREAWGDSFIDNDPDVLALMKQGWTLENALAKVIPARQAAKYTLTESQMRAKVTQELKERGAKQRAAASTTPAGGSAPVAAEGRSIFDIVRDAVKSSGLR